MSNSLWPHGPYSPWNSLGQNTIVGSLALLQEIFPSQGSNPGLPHCRRILYQPSHKGSPRILERVAYPFSSGSSGPRNRTGVSCIAGRFFTSEREFPMWSNTPGSLSGPLFSFCLEMSLLERSAPLWCGLCVLGLLHTHHSGTSLWFTEPCASCPALYSIILVECIF